MGYCMYLEESQFFIAKENFAAVRDALNKLAENTSAMHGGSSNGEKWFSWVDMEYVNKKKIWDIFECWRWSVDEIDEEGNIAGISFIGEKLGQDDLFFKTMAPYVKEGSFIQMQGEDGGKWKWVFRNGKCEEVSGKWMWDE